MVTMWLAFYICLCGSAAAGYEENTFDTTTCNGKVMIPGYAYETLLNDNLNTCAQRCSQDPQCNSFDFDFETCILNNETDPGDCSRMKTADVPSLHYEKNLDVKQCQNGGVLNSNICTCQPGYAGELCQRLIKDCAEGSSGRNGFHIIQPIGAPASFEVLCIKGNTVITARSDSSYNFYRSWIGYRSSFQSTYGDYWIGLDNLHYLTMHGEKTMQLSWKLRNITTYFQFYNNFTVDDELSFYRMSFTSTYGDMGDSFSSSNGKMFSTYDKDNDENVDNCANVMSAGWWFGTSCNDSCQTCRLLQPNDQLRVSYNEVVWLANMASLVPRSIIMMLSS